MKRIAALMLVISPLVVGCSSTSVSFEKRNGVCYRKRVQQTAGCTTNVTETNALLSNCDGTYGT